ncbi:hypothetical protein pb186bvf_006101 [Paramecium bursaria]
MKAKTNSYQYNLLKKILFSIRYFFQPYKLRIYYLRHFFENYCENHLRKFNIIKFYLYQQEVEIQTIDGFFNLYEIINN